MSAPIALTAYPLSQAFRERLEAAVGAPEYVNLPHLRRLPVGQLLRTLASFRGRVVLLPLEDATSEAIEPILHAVAAAGLPASIDVVRPDLARERARSRDLAATLAALARASADGQLAARRAQRELEHLLREPRAAIPFGAVDRILYLNANLWFGLKAGGSIGHLAGVVNGFSELAYDVDLVSATDPILVSAAVHYERLDPPHAFGLPLELNFVRFQEAVVHRLGRRPGDRYGFLYQRMSVLNYAGVLLSRRLRLPLVLEYNGSEVWAARNWGRPLRYERLAQRAEDVSLRHAHVIVTVSEALRRELIDRDIEPDRIACYPNCVDPARYDADRFPRQELMALRARYGIAPDALVAGFIGTFGHWHGVDVLARVIGRLAREQSEWLRRRRLHFLLIGDGLRMPEVRAAIAENGAESFVTLTGLIPQAEGPLHLAACDLLLSPHVPNHDRSAFFGSPTKLFEYMSTGRAIVASELDQIADVLTPAVRVGEPAERPDALAVLTPPGDEAALADAIRLVVDQPDLRATLGRNARQRVLERYTWRHHVESILARIRQQPVAP